MTSVCSDRLKGISKTPLFNSNRWSHTASNPYCSLILYWRRENMKNAGPEDVTNKISKFVRLRAATATAGHVINIELRVGRDIVAALHSSHRRWFDNWLPSSAANRRWDGRREGPRPEELAAASNRVTAAGAVGVTSCRRSTLVGCVDHFRCRRSRSRSRVNVDAENQVTQNATGSSGVKAGRAISTRCGARGCARNETTADCK